MFTTTLALWRQQSAINTMNAVEMLTRKPKPSTTIYQVGQTARDARILPYTKNYKHEKRVNEMKEIFPGSRRTPLIFQNRKLIL